MLNGTQLQKNTPVTKISNCTKFILPNTLVKWYVITQLTL